MPYVFNTAARVRVTPAIDTAIYASGDLIGGKLTLSNACPLGQSGGLITDLVLVDQDNEKSAIDVVFWRKNPSNTTFTDQAPFDCHDTDMLELVGVVSIAAADYVSFADNAVATKESLALAFVPEDGRTLYACLVSRGTPTYTAATDLQLIVTVI
jgi:hypothetical protein